MSLRSSWQVKKIFSFSVVTKMCCKTDYYVLHSGNTPGGASHDRGLLEISKEPSEGTWIPVCGHDSNKILFVKIVRLTTLKCTGVTLKVIILVLNTLESTKPQPPPSIGGPPHPPINFSSDIMLQGLIHLNTFNDKKLYLSFKLNNISGLINWTITKLTNLIGYESAQF